jgi:beta-lactamase class D
VTRAQRSVVTLAILLFTVVLQGGRARAEEDRDLARLLADAGLTGTIVVASADGTREYVANRARAATPMLPASTFKIPNTLIALAEGVVHEEIVFHWDGRDKGLAAWNQDHTLPTAFRTSCVWCYQEIARRVGQPTYERYLTALQYGNQRPGPTLTTFWLDGELRISALEQIAFLRRVYAQTPPIPPAAYAVLRRIMLMEETPTSVLRGKTGWTRRADGEHGWFVGYVEGSAGTWFFATNLEIGLSSIAGRREQLIREALRVKRIVEP